MRIKGRQVAIAAAVVALLVCAGILLAFYTSKSGDDKGAGSPTTSPTTVTQPTTSDTSQAPADNDPTVTPTPGDRVIASRISYGWEWPGPGAAATVKHTYKVPFAQPPEPPLPYLYSIGAAPHMTANPPYDQISFRFKGTFPTYELEYVPELKAGGSGNPVQLPGSGILRVTFRSAQAHTLAGASSITSRPPESLSYKALAAYKQSEDFEGVLTYGLGIGHKVNANPQTRVRVYEVEKIEGGQHLYVVAIQIDASQWR